MKSCIHTLLLGFLLIASIGCRKSTQLSGNMAPTIKSGERVTINYLAYSFGGPRRWDVVAMSGPTPLMPKNSVVLERIIALPGETLSLTSTGIVVNGAVLRMPVALSNVVYCPPEQLPSASLGISFPYTVPPNQYFVVGDNWANSLDSRFYGAVDVTNILGKVKGK